MTVHYGVYGATGAHFFIAYDITEANKKQATLLSECGAVTYKVIRHMVASQKPNELEYATLVKKIQEITYAKTIYHH